MTDLLRLTLPLPFSRNKTFGGRWQADASKKQAYYAKCARWASLTGVRFPAIPWPALLANAVCYPAGINDEGNLIARLKPMEDWIVRQGLVPDDKPKHWHWAGIPQQVVQREQEPFVVLTLQRAEPWR